MQQDGLLGMLDTGGSEVTPVGSHGEGRAPDVGILYSGKFSRVLSFTVFADQGETAKFYTSKF